MNTYIIAEAGVNHNGNLEAAKELVKEAKKAGADAVKFQTFKAVNLVTKDAKKADYQYKNTSKKDTQFEMLNKLELSYDEQLELFYLCEEIGIDFLSTAFDSESLDFLTNKIGLKTLKISSGDLTNAPLLYEFGKSQKSLILSTGMSNIQEIQEALSILAFGLLKKVGPSEANFKEVFKSSEAQEILKEKVSLLHCTTEYPAPLDEINLQAISVLKDKFDLNIGYSDHSDGILVSILAASHGAKLIEKHFTLDKNLEGPDHKSSLTPDELEEMVISIRNIEKIMGDKIKEPTKSELKNIPIARKSIIAVKDIKEGQRFTDDNIAVKRPGTGISPIKFWDILDTKSKKAYKADEMID